MEWKGALEIRGVADGGSSARGVGRSLERQFQHHEEAIVVRNTGAASEGTTGAEMERWVGIELRKQQQLTLRSII